MFCLLINLIQFLTRDHTLLLLLDYRLQNLTQFIKQNTMQNPNPQKFNFYQYQNYGNKFLKGINRDHVFQILSKYSLLMKYYKKNQPQIQTRIIETLMREPSNVDCPGFIYGFKDYNQHKLNPYAQKYDIKLGRTKREVPQDRIYEWENQDGHQYVQLFTIRSEHNNKLESLVHLFFAYARKIKFINGKRRIEWFSFQQKALNAAVTSMINDLMQTVHHIGKLNEAQIPTLSFNLVSLCQEIKEKITSVQFLKKRLVLIGLRKSGKSIVKALLSGDKVKSAINENHQQEILSFNNKFTLQLPNTIDFVENIIQLQKISIEQNSRKDQIQAFKKAFSLWTSVNNVQQICIPCLIVTENDLLSSQMTGFKEALKQFLKYIKIASHSESSREDVTFQQINKATQQFKLFLIITKVQKSHAFTQQNVKKYILAHSDVFSQMQLSLLLNASISFNHLPQKQGNYQPSFKQFINQIESYSSLNSKQKSFSFQYYQSGIQKICEQIIHFTYEQLSFKLQDYYKIILRKINNNTYNLKQIIVQQENENNDTSELEDEMKQLNSVHKKLAFATTIQNMIEELKKSNKQQIIMITLKKILLLLQIEQNDSVLFQLQIFCQCMVKSQFNSRSIMYAEEQYQNYREIKSKLDSNQQKLNNYKRLLSCSYLSSSLVFSKIDQKISQTKIQTRQQLNSIIDNCLKQKLFKTIKQFYSSLDQKTEQGKIIFDLVYNILFKIMNIQAVQIYRLGNQITTVQNVSYDKIEEQMLLKHMNQLLEYSGGKNSKHGKQFNSLISLIAKLYDVSRTYKIKTNSILSRVREAIYAGTKEKKVVQMINVSHENQQSSKSNSNGYKNNSNSTNSNKNNKYNNKSNNNQVIVNGDNVKMILNKKDQQKNSRLKNYIARKKMDSQNLQMLNARQQTVASQNSRNQTVTIKKESETKNGSKNEPLPHENPPSQIPPKPIIITSNKASIPPPPPQNHLQVNDYFQLPQQQQQSPTTTKQQKLNQQEQYYSFPQDQQQFKSLKMEQQETCDVYCYKEIEKMEYKQEYVIKQQSFDDQGYVKFLHQLKDSFSLIKNKSNFHSLKDFNSQVVSKLQKQSRFTEIAFNYFQTTFHIDIPQITFHNSFTIIFSKRMSVSSLNMMSKCDVGYKIHYKNRKPNKVMLILVSELFDGIQNLNIEQNRYGKILIVQLMNRPQKRYKVLDGYFTKNKRNQKKLEQLRVKDLVDCFCKIIK